MRLKKQQRDTTIPASLHSPGDDTSTLQNHSSRKIVMTHEADFSREEAMLGVSDETARRYPTERAQSSLFPIFE
ncbi:hypothetical protein E2C01_060435 [Portunus trituberculatus]|uniref:Uncharacterized protein n=1 Tax=Portunus trituberculatus TaxID=210409 RepID=A0A5B7HBE5_PORTR|nr:hypothetical protein [Portunus trituberculatus]